MSKSLLGRKIDVCQSICKLNKQGCVDVIRLLLNTIRLEDSYQFISKTFMDYTNDWTIDQITQFENEMKISNENYNRSSIHSQSFENKSKINKDVKLELIFPLHRLPIDLISKTSLYLNDKDIFKFERCCRLFYQMINNTSYLNLSNNFKTFIINNKTLDNMSQKKYSFFKYSKTKHLRLQDHSNVYQRHGKEKIEKHFCQINEKWEKAKQVCINDGWFNDMFKSIETLFISDDAMILLDKLPIECLFDPDESHLNEIQFNHYWNQSDERYLTKRINEFERQYLNFQRKLEEQGRQIRQLKVAKHCGLRAGFEGPSYMLAEHLHLNSTVDFEHIDLKNNWLSPGYNPHLRKLTCDFNIKFHNTKMHVKPSDPDDHGHGKKNVRNINAKIETMRLRYFDKKSSHDICNSKIVIETLDLQNSLKCLMLNIDVSDMYGPILTQWKNVIESILKKENFYQLENVIILLDISRRDVDWIFKILTTNVQLLKYQFKQFIVGLRWYCKCHVLEWNKSIDKKYLDDVKAAYTRNDDKQDIQIQMKQKYQSLLLNQWSS